MSGLRWRERRLGYLVASIGVLAALVPGTVAADEPTRPAPHQSSAPPAPSPTAPRSDPADRAALGPASRFVALPPARILDTRTGLGGSTRLSAGQTITLQVTGAGGVSAGATAVALNLTATDTGGAGFVSAWPSGLSQPTVSNVNVDGPGQAVANLAVVALPASGRLDLFSYGDTDLLADVAGYFEPASTSSSGRFVGQVPQRLLDTRSGAPLAAGGQIDVAVAGDAGVPASGASAVVLTVTATEAAGTGFVTAWPTGSERPTASVLNLPAAGATVANLVVAPLGDGGQVSLYSYAGSHLVADVAGYITDTGAPSSNSGLFVPLAPERVLDSRVGLGFACRVDAGQSRDLALGGVAGIPTSGVGAMLTNLTVTDASGAGFVTGWPAGTARPTTSNVNVTGAGDTVAAAAITAVGSGSAVQLYSYSSSHVLADVAGYFLGTPVAPDGTQAESAHCGLAPDAGWLETLNFYRATAGLPGVTADPSLQASVTAHTEWMVQNHTICHCETPGSPGYSEAGDEAARNSNLVAGSGYMPSERDVIEGWMTAPFHADGMLDPALRASAFSLSGDSSFWAGALDVQRGRDAIDYSSTIPTNVVWPGPGSTVPLREYAGNEHPDPHLACPGFDGLPIVALLAGPRYQEPEPTRGFTASITGPAGALEVCSITGASRPEWEYLEHSNSAFVMPRDPLADGTYTVTIRSDTQAPFSWSFTVG